MTINLTMLGQLISFVLFVLFCMKFVWPPLTEIMRERQKALAEGLDKAAAAERQLEEANDAAAVELEAAKKQSAELIAPIRLLKKRKAWHRKKQIVSKPVRRQRLTRRSIEPEKYCAHRSAI